MSAPAGRFRRRDGMLWLVAGIVALVVGGNAVMIWIAVRAQPDLVRGDYYEASKRVDAEREARQASVGLGWHIAVLTDRRTPDALALRITDAAGRPVAGLAGRAIAYRPSQAALDQPLDWQADATASGSYRAVFRRPAPGLWRIRLDLRRDDERLLEELSVVTP